MIQSSFSQKDRLRIYQFIRSYLDSRNVSPNSPEAMYCMQDLIVSVELENEQLQRLLDQTKKDSDKRKRRSAWCIALLGVLCITLTAFCISDVFYPYSVQDSYTPAEKYNADLPDASVNVQERSDDATSEFYNKGYETGWTEGSAIAYEAGFLRAMASLKTTSTDSKFFKSGQHLKDEFADEIQTSYSAWSRDNFPSISATYNTAITFDIQNVGKPVNFENGSIQKFPSYIFERICPLSVTVKGTEIYYIYLHSTDGNIDHDIAFLVSPGSTADIDVPAGSYELYYAIGNVWYGASHLFGTDTVFYKADDPIAFHQELDDVNGYTLKLYDNPDGNFYSRQIKTEYFIEMTSN